MYSILDALESFYDGGDDSVKLKFVVDQTVAAFPITKETKETKDNQIPITKEIKDNPNTNQELPIDIASKITECSLIARGTGGVCALQEAVDKIAESLPKPTKSNKETIDVAKSQTDCATEKCVIEKMSDAGVLEKRLADAILRYDFKIEGPTSVALLNNVNIDDTLHQWQRKFKQFYAYNFNMRDYMSRSFHNGYIKDIPDSLATTQFKDLFAQGIRCCACVINSDDYSGPGKHWMALFADARDADWSVEFFNSSGQDPKPEWVSWMVKTEIQMKSLPGFRKCTNVAVSKVKHQRSKSECGVYSLYYVWARVNGVSYKEFMKRPVDDTNMFKFRQQLFTDPTRMNMYAGNTWSLDMFYSRTPAVAWEA